jgi:hypothetical protein
VARRQVTSCWRWNALNGACSAVGKELSTSFTAGLPVSPCRLRKAESDIRTCVVPAVGVVYGSKVKASEVLTTVGCGRAMDMKKAGQRATSHQKTTPPRNFFDIYWRKDFVRRYAGDNAVKKHLGPHSAELDDRIKCALCTVTL